MITAYFNVNYYSHQVEPQHTYRAAYAVSCDDPGYGGSPEGLDTLYIITKKPYDKLHQANDTINDIIWVGGYLEPEKDYSGAMTVEEYISQNKNNIRDH